LDRPSQLTVTVEFVEAVRSALPPQPWKPGIHHLVCSKLQCQTTELYAAVDRLIEEGVLLRQKDGVLFDAEGNVAGFDPDRVNPQTLELFSKKSGDRD
jgi:hypothetical protein